MDFKETEAYKIHQALYNFHRRFYNVSLDDDYWTRCLAEARAVDQKMNSKLFRDLLAAVVIDLNRRATAMRNGDD